MNSFVSKTIVAIIIACAIPSFTFAEEAINKQNLCTNLSAKQQQSIESITNIIKKTDTITARMVNNDPGASAVIENILKKRQRQLSDTCNYRSLQRYVRKMVGDIIKVRTQYTAFKDLSSDPQAEAAMISLQKHLIEITSSIDSTIYDKPFATTTQANIIIKANIPEMGIGTLSITIGTKGQFDLKKEQLDSNIKTNATMSLQTFLDKTTISIKVLGDIDITMIDDLYIKINALSFDGQSSNQDQQEMISGYSNMIKQVVDILSSKTINMTAGIEQDDNYQTFDITQGWTSILQGQATTYNIINTMNTQSMMKFYRQENGLYYGSINPVVCDIGEENAKNKKNCLANLTEKMYADNGYGSMAISIQNGNTSLALSDTHTSDKMPDNMKHINNKPIIFWNNQNITKADIPFDTSGNRLLYVNDYLNISIKDTETNLSISGTVSKEGSNIKGLWNNLANSYRGTMDLAIKTRKDNAILSTKTNFGLSVYQNTAEIITISTDFTQTTDNSLTRTISKPNPAITTQQALDLLNNTVFGGMFSK